MIRLAAGGKWGGFGAYGEAGVSAALACSPWSSQASAIPLMPPAACHKKWRRVSGEEGRGLLFMHLSFYFTYRSSLEFKRTQHKLVMPCSATKALARFSSL